MEENTLEESISRLLASIKESAEYIEFEKQKEILKSGLGSEEACGCIPGQKLPDTEPVQFRPAF